MIIVLIKIIIIKVKIIDFNLIEDLVKFKKEQIMLYQQIKIIIWIKEQEVKVIKAWIHYIIIIFVFLSPNNLFLLIFFNWQILYICF